eukprot:gnl/Ergobibamus_cyprinoides/786.p1 GENE.gnl/Ergobibamus_cyprinoides/786~~gnl/Ergobibamus_cyprinoides/786.p1  ORF type:complete len:254 (+),score=54.40 gnl/Ergobibamus_cyprinoides/786:105-866(+)
MVLSQQDYEASDDSIQLETLALPPHPSTVVSPEDAIALFGAVGRGDASAVVAMEHAFGCRNRRGDHALLYAVKCGHKHLLRLLAPREAGLLGAAGCTALQLAARSGDLAALRILLPFEVFVVDDANRTALDYARSAGADEAEAETEAFRRVAYAANTHKRAARVETPLMEAASAGNREGCRRTLRDVGRRDGRGRTALYLAAKHGHVACVKLLAPFEWSITTDVGKDAIEIARDRGHMSVISVLQSFFDAALS